MTFMLLMFCQAIMVVFLEYTLLKANSELGPYHESSVGIMILVGLVGMFPVLGVITSLILLSVFWSAILNESDCFKKVPKFKKPNTKVSEE